LIDNQRDLSHYVISPLRTFVRLRILLLDWKKNIEKYTNEKLVTFYISLFSITESVVNPVPVEVILIPSVIKFRKKFIKFALIASIMSTIGALIGYLLGFYLEEYMIRNFIDLSGEAQPILKKYGETELTGLRIFILFSLSIVSK
jgi:membrane protein YqaA with SNARE-associated domain